MAKLTVKRETVVRSMDKENFNMTIQDGTDVKILKINKFDIKDEDGAVIGETNSFVVRLTHSGSNKIATLPGKVLFSSKVLKEEGEKSLEESNDDNFDAFYEAVSEGDSESKDINLEDFENFRVIRTQAIKETRQNILSAQGNKNPEGLKYQLSDYTAFAEVLKDNDNKFEGLDYDKIYASGPKSPDMTPLKTIFIKKAE